MKVYNAETWFINSIHIRVENIRVEQVYLIYIKLENSYNPSKVKDVLGILLC